MTILEINGGNRGQMYKPDDSAKVNEMKRKGKDVMTEELQNKKRVSEEEIIKLIKTLKRSQYFRGRADKVPAQILILSLLLSSEEHRNALLKF